MQNPTENEISKYNDLVWCFLAEYSLNKFVVDENIAGQSTTGLLFQVTQDLGIPLEVLKSIERYLIGFAKEAMVHFNQDRLDSPLSIRLFCQKKTIEELKSAKTSSYFIAEPPAELPQVNHYSETKIEGGWGYFLIERGSDFNPASSESTSNQIDLYLYMEGK